MIANIKHITLTDQDLLRKMASGDESALKTIYDRYYPALYSHAYRRLADREEVRDILQDLFVYLWNQRETIQITTNLSSYLYVAVRNRLLNAFRGQKVRDDFSASLQEFLDEGQCITDELIREKELRILIEQEIAQLPPQMRKIFEMSRNLEMSHREIADALDISPLTVRTQVKKALRILRSKLKTAVFVYFL